MTANCVEEKLSKKIICSTKAFVKIVHKRALPLSLATTWKSPTFVTVAVNR
jgi:hypothetical protein